VKDPLGDVVSRYARTHGPFTAADAAQHLGLIEPAVSEVLTRLERDGKVASGAYRPGGTEHEWVSVAVLTRLRRRSLATLRQQVEAVEPLRYGAFLADWHGIGRDNGASFSDVIGQLSGFAVPASDLESLILPARFHDASRELDRSLAAGDLVWIGAEPLGSRNGRLMLVPRESVPFLVAPPQAEPPSGPLHTKIMEALTASGASFFDQIYQNVGGDPTEAIDALWDLVWAGIVTNDSFAPVRAFIARRSRRSKNPGRMSLSPPHARGRWFLLDSLRQFAPGAEERGLAVAHMLLDRYGIVTRDAVMSEGIPGGFSGLYPVLSTLEDVGSVRRGYFIEGFGGAQFGIPGAIERLRTSANADLVVMAATDPANPYGAATPWPTSDGTPQRRARSTIAMMSGAPIAWMDPAGRSVALFDADAMQSVEAIWVLASGRPRSFIARIDGIDVRDHALGSLLIERGFVPGYKGMSLPRTRDSAGTR
jgi:ATP-dependent Lhr-like helicase